jgi:hypothetical protein
VPLPPPAVGQAYELSAAGRELEPVVLALGTFGSRYLRQPLPGDTVDPRWAMVSMKRRYAGSARSGRVQFELGPQPFALRFGGDSLDVHDGRQSLTDATLSGPVPAWFALFTRQTTLRNATASGALAIEGSRRVLGALIKALGLRA